MNWKKLLWVALPLVVAVFLLYRFAGWQDTGQQGGDKPVIPSPYVENPELSKDFAVIKTNYGDMKIRFYSHDVPNTVEHFKNTVETGFYTDKRFYRIVRNFVIQGGGGQNENKVIPTLKGEFKLRHRKGVISYGHGEDPDSATTEIFICLSDLPKLDGRYAAFGEVVEGMDVLDAIGQVPLTEKYVEYEGKPMAYHEPQKPVVIHSIDLSQ